jgi:hypothetical protein
MGGESLPRAVDEFVKFLNANIDSSRKVTSVSGYEFRPCFSLGFFGWQKGRVLYLPGYGPLQGGELSKRMVARIAYNDEGYEDDPLCRAVINIPQVINLQGKIVQRQKIEIEDSWESSFQTTLKRPDLVYFRGLWKFA